MTVTAAFIPALTQAQPLRSCAQLLPRCANRLPFRSPCRFTSPAVRPQRRPPTVAALHPPNAEVDWVIVDVTTDGLSSESPEVIAEVEDDAKSAVRAILRDASAELSVVLTSDKAIQAVNSQWRGVDSSTDVLAFPQDDPDRVVLGDVLVSLETAERQARDASINTRDEIRILLLHGLLHLLGYDHVGNIEGDWLVMAQMENKIMKMLGWRGEGLVAAAQDAFYRDIIQA